MHQPLTWKLQQVKEDEAFVAVAKKLKGHLMTKQFSVKSVIESDASSQAVAAKIVVHEATYNFTWTFELVATDWVAGEGADAESDLDELEFVMCARDVASKLLTRLVNYTRY